MHAQHVHMHATCGSTWSEQRDSKSVCCTVSVILDVISPLNDIPCAWQVCGKRGHCAGFVGSVYHDCPFKPCYLCKQSGHTTMTCPFRIAPEHGCRQASGLCSDSLLACIRGRERDGRCGATLTFKYRSRFVVLAALSPCSQMGTMVDSKGSPSSRRKI